MEQTERRHCQRAATQFGFRELRAHKTRKKTDENSGRFEIPIKHWIDTQNYDPKNDGNLERDFRQ
jgi:hypothetical protein